ncbi:hypothetical protein FD515_01340 [Cutibacterium acnes]|uniref:hypothetical protein n=1 Tax=Cutibacterium acnes TaxID=1747 RepID=UPI000E344F65|nr:hypothetical protein [Cutibacterium acnes]RFT20373.1 hypothetical protein CGS47_01345 [Cutibacterium acnes]TLG68613.1 hypothetical protein FD515_01340 [Cutibacterium acnes]TNH57890.1 hypothetical protein DMX79_01340 [Cutibacterium acnes]
MRRALAALFAAVVALGALSGCKGSANDPAGVTEVSDAPTASVPSVSQSSGPKPTPQDVNPNTKLTATPQRGGLKDFLPGVTGIISDRVVTGSTSQTVVVKAGTVTDYYFLCDTTDALMSVTENDESTASTPCHERFAHLSVGKRAQSGQIELHIDAPENVTYEFVITENPAEDQRQ